MKPSVGRIVHFRHGMHTHGVAPDKRPPLAAIVTHVHDTPEEHVHLTVFAPFGIEVHSAVPQGKPGLDYEDPVWFWPPRVEG